MTIEIADFPINSMVIFHNYQRVQVLAVFSKIDVYISICADVLLHIDAS